MIEAICPHCGEKIGADEAAAGSEVACAGCGAPFVLQAPKPRARARKGQKKSAAVGNLILAALIVIPLGCFTVWLRTQDHEQSKESPEVVERRAENKRLEAERMTDALKLRKEILDHEWDHLFQEKSGIPSDIVIDEKRDVRASIGGVSINGTAMIGGVKHEFHFGFDRTKDGKLIQDGFRVSEWEEYKPPPKGDNIGAWVAIQTAVEQRLKSPSSAKFPFGGHRSVKHLGGGRFSVSSYVEAQNGFGATVRTPFSGTVVSTGTGWRVESMSLDK